MANIFLEVVGTYYAKIWDVKDDDSVGAAMAEIALKDGTLKYQLESDISTEGDRSLAWISHTISKPIMSRTNKPRNPGVYRIDEAVIGNAVLAWQYYIERPVGKRRDEFIDLIKSGDTEKAQTLRKSVGFKRVSLTFRDKFDLPDNSEPLQDGDIVIWRCVVVLREGTTPSQNAADNLYA